MSDRPMAATFRVGLTQQIIRDSGIAQLPHLRELPGFKCWVEACAQTAGLQNLHINYYS